MSTYYAACSGNFVSGCGPEAYTVAWGNADPLGDSFQLAVGQSYAYLFGTFIPSNGAVAPGTYEFSGRGCRWA